MKKTEIEVALDDYLHANSSQFSGDTRLAPFYKTRGRSEHSPVKKEVAPITSDIESKARAVKRRVTRAAEDLLAT